MTKGRRLPRSEARLGRVFGDVASHPDSLSDVTNVNGPSSDDRRRLSWVIVIGIVGALALVFFLGAGLRQHWGGVQWGPVASWFSGALTLAAVVIALRQASNAQRDAMRLQLARLVDHEVSRRRECIEALAKLWGAIIGIQTEVFAFREYLETLPDTFDRRQQHRPGPLGTGQTWGMETREEVRRFSSEWENRIEPPLFAALLVLRGTPLGPAVQEVNENIRNEDSSDAAYSGGTQRRTAA
jgi:hypothetical protein